MKRGFKMNNLEKLIQQKTEKELEEIAVKARNQYYREYRANNKEKIKSYNLRYWAKKGLEDKQTQV